MVHCLDESIADRAHILQQTAMASEQARVAIRQFSDESKALANRVRTYAVSLEKKITLIPYTKSIWLNLADAERQSHCFGQGKYQKCLG